MEPIATHYAIMLYDPELRSTLARQRQPRDIEAERGTAREIVGRCWPLAFRVRLLMAKVYATRPMAMSRRTAAE